LLGTKLERNVSGEEITGRKEREDEPRMNTDGHGSGRGWVLRIDNGREGFRRIDLTQRREGREVARGREVNMALGKSGTTIGK
jgi:hypothetical protein